MKNSIFNVLAYGLVLFDDKFWKTLVNIYQPNYETLTTKEQRHVELMSYVEELIRIFPKEVKRPPNPKTKDKDEEVEAAKKSQGKLDKERKAVIKEVVRVIKSEKFIAWKRFCQDFPEMGLDEREFGEAEYVRLMKSAQ